MSSRLSPYPGSAASRRCGSPFFLKYVVYASSLRACSLAAGWVFPRGDTVSLRFPLTVCRLRFFVSCLPGPPGGFQVATMGKRKSTIGKIFSVLMAVRELIGNIHVLALWRPLFFAER